KPWTLSAPAVCPRWHGVLLKLSVLSHLVLLVLVVVLSVQVFQKTPTPPNALQTKSEAGGKNRTEVYVIHSLLCYFCRWNGSAGHGGCKLCPPSWQLFGDQCYQVSKSTGNWTDGEKDCESRGSHLAVLRNTTAMEHFSEIIHQDKQPVWIGLKASNYVWKWVDNSSFDATMFGSLGSVENGCMSFRDKKLEVNSCGSDEKWEHLNEGIQRDSKDKRPVWIGLKASKYTWKWVDNSSFDATMFSSHGNTENGCATLKDKKLEVDGCGSDHKWVCQTEPFHLLSKTAGDRDLCGAHPEKTSLQDACC
ncbi:killer cell lectin-like receptor subfamily B member 1B allele A, partial [Aythya fuligula]|uniref:Killer cell lectin-like receptor subfamily B member 1B allele A n=1 Tax=Aythya fuligula TaxID=219594 RepID=A0A6J3EG71_AYTFU